MDLRLVEAANVGTPCPWSWHGLPCALWRAHTAPHHIVGEQPQFDAVLAPALAVLRRFVDHTEETHSLPAEESYDCYDCAIRRDAVALLDANR